MAISDEETEIFAAALAADAAMPRWKEARIARSGVRDRYRYQESRARHDLTILEETSRIRLASAEVPLEPNDKAILEQALTNLRPQFDLLAKIFEPLHADRPHLLGGAYGAIQQLMEICFDMGSVLTLSPSGKAWVRAPMVKGARQGGKNSGKTRRENSEKNWRLIARSHAIKIRAKQIGLSQEKLAAEISFAGWGTGEGPGLESIKKLIREMERSGDLPPMHRG